MERTLGAYLAMQRRVAVLHSDDSLCRVCFRMPKDACLLPCSHLSMCWECSEKTGRCPICCATVAERVRVHLS